MTCLSTKNITAAKKTFSFSFPNQLPHSLSSRYSEDTDSKKGKKPPKQNTTAHTPRNGP